ncbi:polyhomeotic-like protein 3 [Aplochiton taeniatus]
MDRKSPEEKEEEKKGTPPSTPNTSTTVTMATTSASATDTQAPPASLSIFPTDRQAVQVIQQAIQRPTNMAAQYLQQMYAAQHQHLMLQKAALQQQHTPHLQASLIGRRQSTSSPSSSNGNLPQSPVVTQTSITLPTSPVSAQLMGRTQTSNATSASSSISQQAMLLGNGNCNQAQMYLRTQMLILTPAATVSAVQSELPAVSASSSLIPSSKIQSLAVRTHLPAALATAQSVLLKPSSQPQTLVPSLPRMSLCPLKASLQTDSYTDTSGLDSRVGDVARLASGHQIIAPANYSHIQPHALVKHRLQCPTGHRGAHHQLIIQQTAGAHSHRQLQPIALRVSTPDSSAQPLTSQSQPGNGLPTPALSLERQIVAKSQLSVNVSSALKANMCATTTQPQPPPLVAAPQRRGPFTQIQRQPPPPPPPLVLPRLPQPLTAPLQQLSLHSVQALTVQSGQVLVTEEELPVAEALVHMPFHNLPPPQTVAVDLKVHTVRRTETPSSSIIDVVSMEQNGSKQMKSTPTNPAVPDRHPPNTPANRDNSANGLGLGHVETNRSVICSSVDSSHVTTTSSSPPRPLPPPPPSLLPAAVRGPGPCPGPGQPPSAPSSLPGSPDSLLRPHILTHLIEGFVIREGLEPFPVSRTPLMADQQATLPESPDRRTNGETVIEDSLMDAEMSENSSDSEMEEDIPTVDEPEESTADVLQCEFCGKMGYVDTFLRSKRFCSMTCVRRFNVSCTKRISQPRTDGAGQWAHRPMRRRGRPPGRVNGPSREHFLRQIQGPFGSGKAQRGSPKDGDDDEDEPPGPMLTRLQRQAERERLRDQERDRERDQKVIKTHSGLDREEVDLSSPAQWSVEQVCTYINSLPGGREIAQEFRSQEIDGQALLLLTEDHLVSTMNLKLGPSLKLCAHINSLKEP